MKNSKYEHLIASIQQRFFEIFEVKLKIREDMDYEGVDLPQFLIETESKDEKEGEIHINYVSAYLDGYFDLFEPKIRTLVIVQELKNHWPECKTH